MMNKKILVSAVVSVAMLSGSLAFVALTASTQAVAAGTCDINLEVTPGMAYTAKNIDVPKSCKEFTINLKNDGTMAKAMMGHNIVIAKTADQQGILDDGSKAGLASNYVKANDPRVVVATNIIGGGESTSAKFKTSKMNAADSYVFFCSFPGHAMMMKGVVKLV